jgi:hypothetical protein
MGSKVKLDINQGQPVWLSPTVEGGILKMLQDFMLTIERVAAATHNAGVKGPGDVSCVILRDFAKIVPRSDFDSAELSYCSDPDWSTDWGNENQDFMLIYNGDEPFSDGVNRYKFIWRNFYTPLPPEPSKKVTISIDAFFIPGCEDGRQEQSMAALAYPAYFTSLAPDIAITEGIVQADTVNNCYTVSSNSPFSFKWTGISDLTYTVILRKDDAKLTDSFTINGFYDHGKVKKNTVYELSATNSYNFSDIRVLSIVKTNWHNKGVQKGLFEGDVYGNLNYNARIFAVGSDYYAYRHPALYQRGQAGEWNEITVNSLYSGKDYSCHAAYLHDGVLHVAGNIKTSAYFSFCRYRIADNQWKEETGRVRVPKTGEPPAFCCGFAFSANYQYFYHMDTGYIAANRYEQAQGWSGGEFYFNAPEGMNLCAGTLGFYINQFYMAMLCEEDKENGSKFAYLYDCRDESEKFLFRLKVSQSSTSLTMLETENYLWLQTENELINCGKKDNDEPFIPPVPDGKRAWLGSDGINLLGIFPDKNLWIYEED